jgi:transmembrane sensor
LATAWRWVLRLERGEELSPEELSEWLHWYEADRAHRGAFDDMLRFWQQLDRVTEGPQPLLPALWLSEDVVPRSGGAPARPRKPPNKGFFRSLAGSTSPRAPAWGAAGLGLVLALMLLRSASPPQHPARAPTAAAPPAPPVAQTTTLPDGSRVELAPQSSVAVRYTSRLRLLKLEGGEGYFIVAHNPARPFIVAVGRLDVRAVGTAFNIRSAGHRIVVTVTKGTIDVYPSRVRQQPTNGAVPPDAIRVTAGSEVTWTPRGPTVTFVDPTRALAWLQGRLEYFNEPLASAVADLNRYRAHPVRIGDPAVGRIVFSGTVLIHHINAWIDSLPSVFPVVVEHEPDGSLILLGRSAPVLPRAVAARARASSPAASP